MNGNDIGSPLVNNLLYVVMMAPLSMTGRDQLLIREEVRMVVVNKYEHVSCSAPMQDTPLCTAAVKKGHT